MQCEAAMFGFMRRRCFLALCLAALISLACCLACVAMLMPEPSGDTVYEKSGTTVDASHAEQGYIMVKQSPAKGKFKLRVSQGKYNLTYDLNNEGEYEVYPLQLGSGKYKVQVFKQVSGKKYSTVSSISFKANLLSEDLPYLYPNQYVSYDESTLAVAKAAELCEGLESSDDKFNAIHAYVLESTTYNYERAKTVKSGYLPDIDEVYTSRSGICFDISALMACMLRSQGVPTQLVIGYADKVYHAWNLVMLADGWTRCDATSDICKAEVKSYTTERMY